MGRTLPELPCACASLRRAARVVTQFYDGLLRPAGLRSPQFTLLSVLAEKGPLTRGALAAGLAFDPTTLSRTLASLRGRGWVRAEQGRDRRERRMALTTSGRARLRRAAPRWRRAQRDLQALLGRRDWSDLLGLLNRVVRDVPLS